MTSSHPMPKQPNIRRTPLSRARVLAAAVALADEGGLDAFSMRGLAQELGVVPMALYKHVANKDALLDAMIDIVFEEIELLPGISTGARRCAAGRCRHARRSGATPGRSGSWSRATRDRRTCETTTP